jgi:lysyl-tRNA synthetase class 2
VGGFEKVYELNRNFRNEGISTKHNPEFTMLEYYWAYADVNDMMDLHEEMMRSVVYTALGHTHVRYGDYEIDFSQPFQSMTMKDAIAKYRGSEVDPNEDPVRITELFEEFAEPHLIQPTFITDFPKPVSPLSKASPSDPSVAERFEYFVGALESANGFSELNDPEEQYQRFKDQAVQRERGDEEAMLMDEDYIRALSYGMPPAAGIGVGIDRLVMLLANKHSIRDVILFPHLRPERTEGRGPEADGSKTGQ